MEQPHFTDGKIFTKLVLQWTLHFKQNRVYFF